ncbi:lipocalin family protein [Parabacteroides distasonis]|jgi:hypothetical protein|uniref:lipocalin family protein n=1 Tax=Parabacteroides distasonis TaxID=823 RepID=UPI001C38857D|nr:lipocalin family protein [Parabacteroides distasonis]MBV4224585.1 lipocalin family protein [Parabacteroides distasonis]
MGTKNYFILVLVMIFSISCEKEKEFIYDKKLLIGTWELTEIDYTEEPPSIFITFQADGTVKVLGPNHGIYNPGSGIYKIDGDMIECYSGNICDTRNQVIALTTSQLELITDKTDGSYGFGVKCKFTKK